MDRAVFLCKFIIEPKKIGSITPSSSFLTRKMLSKLPWDQLETVVELGAGTGVFTRFISENKKESCKVLVIEQDSEMREALQVNYPDFFYGGKAEQLERLLSSYNMPQVDCIISGLPFAIFPEAVRENIIGVITRSLKPEGIFTAFQYSLQMRKTLQRHFGKVKIDFVPINMPPAFIYYCKK